MAGVRWTDEALADLDAILADSERAVLGTRYILLCCVERDDLVLIMAGRHGARERRI